MYKGMPEVNPDHKKNQSDQKYAEKEKRIRAASLSFFS